MTLKALGCKYSTEQKFHVEKLWQNDNTQNLDKQNFDKSIGAS